MFLHVHVCNCRLKVKEDVIAELHGNVLKKDEEIASLRSMLDEQNNKNNVRCSIVLPPAGMLFGFEPSMHTTKVPKLPGWLAIRENGIILMIVASHSAELFFF